ILYNADTFHPALAGTYLNAVTIFTTMFPRHFQTDYTAGLSPADAEYLQQVGQNVVLDNLRLLNIK
ncbi:MAG: SGNH/GDSL hydrolase family protein, partial [Muribaculaceae bacterium]|nr:SGNH/GDSL hydrolase family protein [Muribaculaceae bacterium]